MAGCLRLSAAAAVLPRHNGAAPAFQPSGNSGLSPVAPFFPFIHALKPPIFSENLSGGWGLARIDPAWRSGGEDCPCLFDVAEVYPAGPGGRRQINYIISAF